MNPNERPAFDAALAEIFAALDKPLGDVQREAMWKGCQRMSILEFSRCRDFLLQQFAEGERPARFGVPEIWAAKRKLRASGPPEVFQRPADGFTGDDWDVHANLRLLGYILRKCVHYISFDPRQTRVLVAFKNRWAELMRRSGTCHEVDNADQDAAWIECIRMAEQELSREKAA